MKLKSSDFRNIELTIRTACEPLTKEEMFPAMYATLMGYFEARDFDINQVMNFITETFGLINKLKINGTLQQVMNEKAKKAVYSR